MAMIAAGAAAVGYFQWNMDRNQSKMKVVSSAGKLKLGGPWKLIDTDGKEVSSDDYKGKYTLIYFGFTHCPDVCPVELHKMADALKLLDGKKDLPTVHPIFVTVDPKRDTPARLKEYAKGYHPRLRYLTGSNEELASVTKAFRVYFSIPDESDENYLVDHSIFFYLMDRNNEILDYYGKNYTAEEMAVKIAQQIIDDQKKQ